MRYREIASLLSLGLLTTAQLLMAQAGAVPRAGNPPKDVRFVILHTPGPNWEVGKPIFDQVGVQAHIDYYRRIHSSGKLVLGGPFLDGSAGGMMVPETGLTEEEVNTIAREDPAVKSGLLRAAVRPWLIGMKK